MRYIVAGAGRAESNSALSRGVKRQVWFWLACGVGALACREEPRLEPSTNADAGDGGQSTAVVSNDGGIGGATELVGADAGASGEAGARNEGGAAACSDNPLVVEYGPDLAVQSPNGMTVTLTRSAPRPGVGNHTWSFVVVSPEGEAVEGATVRVTPFMPEHRHGSPLTAVVEELGEGAYEAYPVEFTMKGYWRTTIRVVTSDWTDAAIFPLCID
jgi:hypothetical protein